MSHFEEKSYPKKLVNNAYERALVQSQETCLKEKNKEEESEKTTMANNAPTLLHLTTSHITKSEVSLPNTGIFSIETLFFNQSSHETNPSPIGDLPL